jgi:hypothetical protein
MDVAVSHEESDETNRCCQGACVFEVFLPIISANSGLILIYGFKPPKKLERFLDIQES